jgi:hypothetical protein
MLKNFEGLRPSPHGDGNIQNVPGVCYPRSALSATTIMATIPGTQVKLQFFTFASHYPPLYEPAGQGSLNLASINAGNSDGLCVGLGGVNSGFYRDLTQHANQQRVNLSPNQSCQPGHYDDYQDRHLKLIAQAAGGAASATYTNTDPCAFSYVNAKLVTQAPGYYEGAAFVDIFDPALRPYGNAKNVAMLYLAPPYDGNHASQADFLQAIEATAEKIIETVAGYNTLATQQNLPVIEALRNTLFSSNIYNQRWSVKADLIAGAILAGFTTALHKNPAPGLVELQFPVGSASDPLFASLQSGLAGTSTAPPIMVFPKGGDEVREDDNDDADQIELPEVDGAKTDSQKVQVAAANLAAALAPVRAAADALNQILASQGPPQVADPNYAAIPQFKNQYEAPDSPMNDDAPVNLPPPALTPVAEACRQAGLRAVQAGNEIVQAEGDFQKISTARTDLETAVNDADAQRKLAKDAYSQYPSPGNKRSAEHAQEVAEAARRIRDAVPKIVRKGNRAELARKTGTSTIVASIIAAFFGAGVVVTAATIGGLIGTRSNYKPNGKKKEIAVGESTATITLGDDPAPPEGLTVSAAFLLDPSSKARVSTFAGKDGTWKVTKPTEITYTVTNQNVAKIQFVLEFSDSLSGLAPHYSEPADIEISFAAPEPPPVLEDPKDITVLATDRTSAVKIPVPTGSTLATGTETDWTISTENGTTSIVFTPNMPTSVTKRAVYLLNSKMANIVVLLPATPIQPLTEVPRVNPPAITIFDATKEKGVELTLLDAAGTKQTSITKDGVTWSISETSSISINTTALQDSTASVSVSYGLKYGDKITPAATLTLNFAPAATPVDV